jgi:hypothetical protein
VCRTRSSDGVPERGVLKCKDEEFLLCKFLSVEETKLRCRLWRTSQDVVGDKLRGEARARARVADGQAEAEMMHS